MADLYAKLGGGLESPARHAVAVTPDNDNDLTTSSRSLYVGVSGDIKVTLVGDSAAVTFILVPVGIFPIRAKRVFATGTTATDIIAIW